MTRGEGKGGGMGKGGFMGSSESWYILMLVKTKIYREEGGEERCRRGKTKGY